MPDESSIFDFAIRGHFEGIRGMEKLHKAIQDASQDLGVVSPRTLKRLQTQIGGVAKSFNDVLGKAGKGNLYKLTEHVRSSLDKAGQDFQKQFVAVKTAAEALEEVQKTGSDMEKEAAKRTLDAEKKKFDALERRLKKEAQAIDAMMDRRERAAEFFNRGVGEIGADLADGLAEGLGKLSSGDVRGLTDAVAGGLKTGGSVAKTSAGGAGALAKLGKAAFALSGAVMAIGAIVKILIDADSQTKDWNKSLLQTAGAADFALDKASGGFKDLEGTLKSARDAAISVGWQFGQTPEDMLKIVAAANEAGFTFDEMAKNLSASGDSGEAFRTMMEDSFRAAKTLGVSTEEIAQMTAGWMHDFAGGQETIRQGYAAIFQASLEAGIGSKRFFTMVQQATAGLALYNVRVEQTAALIAELSKSLGEEGAAQFVTDLQKGFTNESMTDRFKRIMTSGGTGNVGKVLAADARMTMRQFQGGANEGVRGTMAAAGITGTTDQQLKKLAELNDKDRRALVRRVMESDEAAGRKLTGLIDLAKGMEGGIGAQAKAFDNLSAGGKLAMQLTQASEGVFKTPLSEMTAIQLAGFEQMTGLSGEQLEAFRRVDEQVRAEYDVLVEQAKAQGSLDKLESFEDYLVKQGERFEDSLSEAQDPMERMTEQLVSNSESLLNLLSTTFKAILEGISTSINRVAQWASGMSQTEIANQNQALETLAKDREALSEVLGARKKQLGGMAADDPRRQALADEVASLEESLAKNRAAEREVRSTSGSSGISFWGLGWDKSAEDMLVEGGVAERKSKVVGHTRKDGMPIFREWTESQLEGEKKLAELQAEQNGTSDDLLDEAEKTRKKMPGDIVREMERKEARSLMIAAGLQFDNSSDQAKFMEQLAGGDAAARERIRAGLEATGNMSSMAGTAAGFGINLPSGTVTSGVATPAGGGVGGRGVVNITINGGDEAKIYAVVKRALRESGIRPPPGTGG